MGNSPFRAVDSSSTGHARAIELHKVKLGFVVHPIWNHRRDQHTGRGRDSEQVDRYRVSQVLCRKPREIGQGSWDVYLAES